MEREWSKPATPARGHALRRRLRTAHVALALLPAMLVAVAAVVDRYPAGGRPTSHAVALAVFAFATAGGILAALALSRRISRRIAGMEAQEARYRTVLEGVSLASSLSDSAWLARLQEVETVVGERTAELKTAVEDLKLRNRELEEFEFGYVASHDLKEPLRGIHNYVSFLMEEYCSQFDEVGRGYLERMQRLTERLTAMVDGIFAYARLGSAPLAIEPIDMEAVLDGVAADLEVSLASRGVELRRVGRLPSARGNAERIGEVFQNLIDNSAKYNDKAAKWVEVGCDASGPEPVFYVRDNGIGIPEAHRESVFRMFKRLHPQNQFGGGTGVGLAIVKRIVERHGGRIWLESMPGEGTCFYFTLSGGA